MFKINDEIFNKQHFPDGTQSLKYNTPKCTDITIEWIYESDEELFTLYCLKKHIDYHKHPKTTIRLKLAYLPNARMDRTKNSSDVFTLKYFCEIINSLNFDVVYVRDPHSNVSTALLNRVECDDMNFWLNKCLRCINCSNLVLFFPDEGAMKRYSSLIKHPYTFGVKNREWETGKIKNLILMNEEMVKDKNILIVDDICSYGGTFQFAAEALKRAGARDIYLYISHAEKNMIDGAMYNGDLIKKIYTTNSIFKKEYDIKDKVKVFNNFF